MKHAPVEGVHSLTLTINVDSNILHPLFIGDSKDAGVAKLLESVLNQVLQAQVTEQLDVERYERAEERKGYRNGVTVKYL